MRKIIELNQKDSEKAMDRKITLDEAFPVVMNGIRDFAREREYLYSRMESLIKIIFAMSKGSNVTTVNKSEIDSVPEGQTLKLIQRDDSDVIDIKILSKEEAIVDASKEEVAAKATQEEAMLKR